MYAAGLTMRPENVEEFKRRFNQYVEDNINPKNLIPQVEIDSLLSFGDITPNFFRELNRFQPFGPGNNLPIFASEQCLNSGDAKLVGADAEHLRRDLTQDSAPSARMQAIAFQQPTHYEWVRAGKPIDICYQIIENNYRGKSSLQLRIKDIKHEM